MRDESTAAKPDQVEGTRLKTSSGSARFSLDKNPVAKRGGRLSGEFSESISLIKTAIYSKDGKQTPPSC